MSLNVDSRQVWRRAPLRCIRPSLTAWRRGKALAWLVFSLFLNDNCNDSMSINIKIRICI